jgi:hypothetical protein
MQPQHIVLIPPSDEQAYPAFHVTKELAAAFIAHLADRGIEVRDPPTAVGRLGPQHQDVVELELTDDTLPVRDLERAVDDFFAERTVSNG